jgi:hypothetical protein
MSKVGEQITVILIAIVGVSILAIVLSKNANTTGVISAAAGGFSTALAAALSPITGNSGVANFGGLG